LRFFLKGDLDSDRRHGLTEDESGALEQLYMESGGYPTKLERWRLMKRFSVSKEKVFRWFQNKRAREKRREKQMTEKKLLENGYI
jgi:hypothetical protein